MLAMPNMLLRGAMLLRHMLARRYSALLRYVACCVMLMLLL